MMFGNPLLKVLSVSALTLCCAACGKGASDTPTAQNEGAVAAAPAESEAAMPTAPEGKSNGTLTGTIAGNPLALEGTCSSTPQAFEFWSDGKDFAVGNDSNGDGQYLNIMVVNANGKPMASLDMSKDGAKVYRGTFSYSTSGDAALTVDSKLGREQAIAANFEVKCG